ncbi:hypothetical protein IFR04_011065 [Cadophora malorum]|uniref:YDG domain-containing protein n=1 Tax=Cadophora malorum TaxID=108018 RepID=A0A8H7W3F8_9HELO|nr:hypothetical protein IFR04_011065 [Cadophora malorum]
MDHQDLTPSLAMNTSTIIKAESTEVEMVNFDATTTSSATCNDADPLFTSLIHWVGPEISSSTFGPLQASEAEVIKNFSDTARAVGVTSKRQQYIDEDQWDEVKMLLWRLWQITEFDRELGQKMNVKGILIMFAMPANNFISPVPEVAEDLKVRFEGQNWGVPRQGPAVPTSHKSNSTAVQKSRAQSIGDDEDTEGNSATQKGIWTEAPPNHSIFGINGCMHHIALTDTNHYEICCQKGNAAVFGHNGFRVGQCWARQVAAVRDGVHGCLVYYSVSGALTTTDREPDTIKYTTRAMIRSVKSGLGIRVLRTAGGGWNGCPRAGMRYDGLYRAVAYQVKANDKGGKFLQFELVRMDGQPDIDEDKPTWQEKVAFERVKDGY